MRSSARAVITSTTVHSVDAGDAYEIVVSNEASFRASATIPSTLSAHRAAAVHAKLVEIIETLCEESGRHLTLIHGDLK